MNENINILDMPGVIPTEKFKSLVINKRSDSYPVYRVPLKYLFYNDQNDRISTEIVRYTSENHTEIPEDRDEYNTLFEKFIVDSKEDAIVKTQKSIKTRGQDNPGVTLIDGRVVDGNRRLTCLRRIQRENNIEQFFETVILDMDYKNNYKYMKSLELELQMGVEGPVHYDPIDRLFGVYKSIIIEKAFSLEEYAALFDNRTVINIRDELELAKLMCDFLEFMKCSGKYYIAKDMKLDGVLHEIPAILEKVRKKNPDDVDEFKILIFSYIMMGVDNRINIYIRDLKNIIDHGDYRTLLNQTNEHVEKVMDINEKVQIDTITDISDKIRSNIDVTEGLLEATNLEKRKVESKKLKKAPLKYAKDSLFQLNSIHVDAIPQMSKDDLKAFETALADIEIMLNELRDYIEP